MLNTRVCRENVVQALELFGSLVSSTSEQDQLEAVSTLVFMSQQAASRGVIAMHPLVFKLFEPLVVSEFDSVKVQQA